MCSIIQYHINFSINKYEYEYEYEYNVNMMCKV